VPYWTIVACEACGVHFPSPFPARDEIAEYYADQLSHNEWEQVHYVDENELSVGWKKMAEKLTRLCGSPGHMLEIGPAAGHLMKAAERLSWSVVGVEAAPKFVKILRERQLHVHEGTLETFESTREFDLIVMFDVLEHLHDPVGDLRRCAELLAPTGRLVLATCDIESLAARHYGLRWRQIVISHTFYWTRRSLAVALRRARLEPTQFASVRWWDPNPVRQALEWVAELVKLVIRKLAQSTWMPLAERWPLLKRFQASHPKFVRWLHFKVGEQAVMSEVALVVAERR
jgi:2-polyprenyl-3-methyl-5-hydroxy-6-metoxy-1,4-benzoquinol methylase